MSYFPKRAHYIGIDLEKSTLKMAAVRPIKKGWQITQLKETSLQDASSSLDLFPEHARITSALDAKEVFIRPLELPLKRDKEIKNAAEFQATSLLPFPVDQAIVETQIQTSENKKTRVNLLATKKNHLEKHLLSLSSLGLLPKITTAVPIALAAFASILLSRQSQQLVVHIGETEGSCALILHGHLVKSYSINPSQNLIREIRKIILSLSQESKSFEFDTIVLMGNVSEDLRIEIQENCKKTTLFPVAPDLLVSQEKLIRYGLAIGTALAATSRVNFLKKEYAPKEMWSEIRKPLSFFMIGMCALSLFVGALGWLMVRQQKFVVQQQFEALMIQEGLQQEAPQTLAAYNKALEDLNHEIVSRPETFPLFPQIPTVSEIMSWLLHHQLATKPGDLEIHSLHYAMVKHPTLQHPTDRYQVQVTLELKTATSQLAKMLRDALEQDVSYVDHKQEIQWTTSKDGIHRVSFFLKDKTRYH